MANTLSYGKTELYSVPIDLTATIVVNRYVKFDGSGYAGADDDSCGVSDSAGVSGDQITCQIAGVALVDAGAALATAFMEVECDSSGRVVTLASGRKRGTALDIASAAGDRVRVLMTAP